RSGRRGRGDLDGLSGLYQHGCESGRAANQRPDSAVNEFWWFSHFDEFDCDSCGAQSRLRKQAADEGRPRMSLPIKQNKPRTALVMAGGTGGHIFPGLAVAQELRARGWNVHWL